MFQCTLKDRSKESVLVVEYLLILTETIGIREISSTQAFRTLFKDSVPRIWREEIPQKSLKQGELERVYIAHFFFAAFPLYSNRVPKCVEI